MNVRAGVLCSCSRDARSVRAPLDHTSVRCRIMSNRFAVRVVCSFFVASCASTDDGPGPAGPSGPDEDSAVVHSESPAAAPPSGKTTANTPIGIALDLEDGVGVPLKIRSAQRFYIQQIDLRAHLDGTTDEGVAGLARLGDFANLDWRDTRFVDESFVSTPNPDGT